MLSLPGNILKVIILQRLIVSTDEILRQQQMVYSERSSSLYETFIYFREGI